MSQWVRRSSPKNTEAVMKTIQGFLDVNFIFEVKLSKWLSNVLLVKKASGK